MMTIKINFAPFSIVFILLYLISCSQSSQLSPEEFLQKDIKKRFETIKGPDGSKVGLHSFKIKDKLCEKNQCKITYLLNYQTSKDGKVSFKTEVKKMAHLQIVNGEWNVLEVTNLKTYHEASVPLDL